MSATTRSVDEPLVLPSLEDPIVATSSTVISGPVGRFGRGYSGGWWTPLRILLVLTFVVCGAGFVTKQPCRDNGWAAPQEFLDQCYSDAPYLYTGRGLDRGAVPYYDDKGTEHVEYPVLTGAVMWATARLSDGRGSVPEQARWFFDINAILSAAAAAGAVWATVLSARRRPWDASMFALAPGLALTFTINWDLWAVLLLAAAMLAWARERPVLAGVLVGLATATKFYPLLLLGPLLLLCLRAGRMRAFWQTTAAATVAWLVVNLPVALTATEGWGRFYAMSRSRGPGFGSIWLVLEQKGWGLPQAQLNLVASGLFLLSCVGIAVLALRAPRRPRLASLTFLTVAAFLLTNKVYSPQYVLWLLPLAALARPRWRDILVWQAFEAVHFVGTWLYIAHYTTPNRAMPEALYQVTVLVHIAGTLWLVGLVVRDALRSELDPVRADGLDDDPGGGVVDGVADTAWADAVRRGGLRAAVLAPRGRQSAASVAATP